MADSPAVRLDELARDIDIAEKAGNWQTALNLFIAAEGILARTPDSEKDGLSMNWRGADIARHIQRLEKLVNQTTGAPFGLQRVPVEFKNPGCD